MIQRTRDYEQANITKTAVEPRSPAPGFRETRPAPGAPAPPPRSVDVRADTIAPQPGAHWGGSVLGVDGLEQQAMFHGVMSKLFEQTPEVNVEAAVVGRFTVLHRLGEGGMGVVYAAYDAELDRKVAIKLVREEVGNVEIKARLLREAQAMARLSHPNVVSVYDVGIHRGQIYVAMEFIKGQTLETAAREARARGDWRAILAMFRGAGEGLAAAHDADLVHRDFKPDNVLIGDDGRARVLDFGLVRSATLPAEGDTRREPTGEHDTLMDAVLRDSDKDLDVGLTRDGTVMGTPAYMSPEQIAGKADIDEASDQFSFCASLHEALYGELPFPGSTMRELFDSVTAGDLRPPPRKTPVPAWIGRALARGLSTDPADRWPSMRALLDTLRQDPGRRYRIGAAVLGAVALVSSVSYGAAMAQTREARACESAGRELAEVWTPARKHDVREALLGTGVAFAEDAWTRVEERLDRYAEGWGAMRQGACEAHQDGVQSAELLDLRMICLDRHRGEFEAAIEVLSAADRGVVENAVELVTALPQLSRCEDADVLRAEIAPPEDADVAAAVEEIRGQLGRAAVYKHAGMFREGLELTQRLRARAEPLQYAPILARALLVQGDLEMESGAHEDAARTLHRAIWLAVEIGDDEVAAEAVSKWFYVSGGALARADQVRGFEPLVLALSRRVAASSTLRPLAHNNLGTVHYRQGELEQAERGFRGALSMWEALEEPNHIEMAATLNNLGVTLSDRGQYEEGIVYLERAVALVEHEVGGQHPSLAYPLFGLAGAQLELGETRAARDKFTRAVELIERTMGESAFFLVYPLSGLGRVHLRDQNAAEAIAAYERALTIWRASGVKDRDHGDALCGYGEALRAAEREDDAAQAERDAAAMRGEACGRPP